MSSSSSSNSGGGCLTILIIAFVIWFVTTQPWNRVDINDPNALGDSITRFIVQNNPFPTNPEDTVKKLSDAIQTRSWSQYRNAFEPSSLMEPDQPGLPGMFSDLQFTLLDSNELEALVGVLGRWTPSDMSSSDVGSFYIDEEIRVVKAKKDVLGSIEVGGGNKINTGIGIGGWFVAYDQKGKLPFNFSGQIRDSLPPSPKGTIAYCQGTRLMLSDGEGRWPVDVAHDLGDCGGLNWTPDGQSLLVSQIEKANRGKSMGRPDIEKVYLIELPNLHRYPVAPELDSVRFLESSPDSAWFIVSTAPATTDMARNSDLLLIARDGSRVARLTEGLDDAILLGWSVDSQRVFLAARNSSLTSAKAKGSGSMIIYAVNVNDTSRDYLVKNVEVRKVAWETGGKKLAFLSSGTVYVLEMDPVRLIDVSGSLKQCDEYAWVPNASRILLQCGLAGTQWRDVWMVNSDGTDLKMLTDGSQNSALVGCAPNGDQVAFVRYREAHGTELWAMKLDGTERTLLIEGDVGLFSDINMVWSPDSKKLAFRIHYSTVLERLFVVDMASKTTRRVASGSNIRSFAWFSNNAIGVSRFRQTVGATQGWSRALQIVDVNTGAWRWLTVPGPSFSYAAWTYVDHSTWLADLAKSKKP